MKYTTAALLTALTAAANAAVLPKRSGSNSWAGTSSYFIQGMSSDAQDSYIEELANDGAKVMRVWVNSLGTGCQKGSQIVNNVPDLEGNGIGQYTDESLDYLDQTLVKLGQHGMKALVSLHDGNDLVKSGGNGCDAYCNTYGSDGFYTSSTAASQFDQRLEHILNYQGKYSGKTWGNYSDVIMAFDIENEPMQFSDDICQAGTSPWICDRAKTLRSTLGGDNPIKIASGGIGGDYSHNCNFMASAVSCPELDIISVHRYGGDDNSFSSLASQWASKGESENKLIIVEEFGVKSSFSNGFDAQTADITSGGVPWLYWEVVPKSTCSGGDDGYTFYLDSSNGNPKQAFSDAANKTAAQDWTGVVY